jgi:hypothetical protein
MQPQRRLETSAAKYPVGGVTSQKKGYLSYDAAKAEKVTTLLC